ncbi:MAG: hypothetical protein HZA08_09800 [Nitrospirae bacterium]|nr:hypothetical protein [Nitrospirota bacterium]
MNKKILKLVIIIALSSACGVFAFDSVKNYKLDIRIAEVDDLPKIAGDIVSDASSNVIGAKGASQISQVMDESRIQIDLIQVKQNQEIIR